MKQLFKEDSTETILIHFSEGFMAIWSSCLRKIPLKLYYSPDKPGFVLMKQLFKEDSTETFHCCFLRWLVKMKQLFKEDSTETSLDNLAFE